MSVLIKGVAMPTSCSACPMLEGDRMDGLCHAASKWLDDEEYWTWYVYPEGDIDDSKPCNCPLVSVPPHGELIDRGYAIATACSGLVRTLNTTEGAEEKWIRVAEVRESIKSAPTIIEAESEGA